MSGASGSIDATLDRKWDDTWYARVGLAHEINDYSGFAFGLSYDSSPVKDRRRTIDLPMDEYYQLSGTYLWKNKSGVSYSLGATLMMIGDAEVKQSTQGVTYRGDFDTNYIVFLGSTLRYEF